MKRDYRILVDGKVTGALNERLAIRQGVTDEQLEKLKELHVLKDFLFCTMKSYEHPSQGGRIHDLGRF